LPLTFSRYQP